MSKILRVYFYVRSSYKRSDGKNPILVRLYLNNERTDLCSTSCFVEKELWDSSKGRVKGRSSEALVINTKLDNIELDLLAIYRRYEFDKNLSLDLIKGKFLGKEEDEEKEVTFMNLLDEHIKNLKEEIGVTRTKASYCRFNVLKRHFVNFLKKKYKRSDLKLGEVTYKVVTDFERYLKTQTSYSPNHIASKMKNMKTITIIAKKLGLMDKDPFIDFKIRFHT